MMANDGGRDVVHRFKGNPLISMDDVSFRCADIRNAGAIYTGEEYVLLVTVQELEGFFSIYTARSKNGQSFVISKEPVMSPSSREAFAEFEERGVLDARIVFLEGRYYITYDAFGRHGYTMGLACTEDFENVERLGIISQPDVRAGALFPRKIGGVYMRLERPWEGGSIWISSSEDLLYWGRSEVVMTPRQGYWDTSRIGPAAPPFEIEEGWMLIYYGIKETVSGPLFRLGAAILDRENPAQMIGRTNVAILAPREEYERIGDVRNLVFSCGAVLRSRDEIMLFYGAADSCVCLGTTNVEAIVEACAENGVRMQA